MNMNSLRCYGLSSHIWDHYGSGYDDQLWVGEVFSSLELLSFQSSPIHHCVDPVFDYLPWKWCLPGHSAFNTNTLSPIWMSDSCVFTKSLMLVQLIVVL
jgi:hypothetical protein